METKLIWWKIKIHGTTKNLSRELDHQLSKLSKRHGERKHYLYRKLALFNTGKMRPKFRVPVTVDKDVPKIYYLSFFILTSLPRGINVTFTSFSVCTRAGSFTPCFLGWLQNMPVQHTATQRLLISAVVLKSKSQQKYHCCKKVIWADGSPLGKSQLVKTAQL